MKCLILAAGKGSRLQHKGSPKPLIKILGVPLIERVIRTAIEAGADDFYVVLGNKADILSSFLSNLSSQLKIKVTTIYNEKWDCYENGYSVLKAEKYLKEPFLLLMADHIVDLSLIKNVISSKIEDDKVYLGVDIRKENKFIDFDDVTKVKYDENCIINDIGKDIEEYDGYDTGVFYCSPVIFEALKKAKKNGKTTLSEAIKILGEQGLAYAVKIDNGFWIDVDTDRAIKNAEEYLLEKLRDKANDGIISKRINRNLSIKISKFLVNYPVTPNQISVFSFLLSCFAAYLFSIKSYLGLFIGAIIAQFASIIDGCDGEVARLKFQTTKYGGWFDAVLDRYADAFLIWGLMWHHKEINSFFWGILALIGSFMVSYTADKYDALMREKIKSSNIRIGRDLRIFIIFIGAIFNLVNLTLAILSIIMNIEVIRRLWICREKF